MKLTHCPKCHASRGALHVQSSALKSGDLLHEVRCILCGWHHGQPAPIAGTGRVRDTTTTGHVHPKSPCTHLGCTGVYTYNQHGLCQNHSNKLNRWIRLDGEKRGIPAPYLLSADGTQWIDNPHYQKRNRA